MKLAAPDWRLTEAALREAFTPETSAILVNSPLNPIGRVFDRAEMDALARVVKDSKAVAICDEVYEHLVFDGRAHIPLAALPGWASGACASVRRARCSRSPAGKSAGSAVRRI